MNKLYEIHMRSSKIMLLIIFGFWEDAQVIKSSGDKTLDCIDCMGDKFPSQSGQLHASSLLPPTPNCLLLLPVLLICPAWSSLLVSLPFPKITALLGTAPLAVTFTIHGLPESPARPAIIALESQYQSLVGTWKFYSPNPKQLDEKKSLLVHIPGEVERYTWVTEMTRAGSLTASKTSLLYLSPLLLSLF